MKTIIVAVDFSNATLRVTDIAIQLAKSFGASLQLFHVVEPEPGYAAYGFTPSEFPAMAEFHEEAKRRAVIKLDQLLAKVRMQVPGATSVIVEGSPLSMLLDHIRQSGADFIVVGSHGHGVIASLLLGSVAEGMVRKASIPTLVVPAARE